MYAYYHCVKCLLVSSNSCLLQNTWFNRQDDMYIYIEYVSLVYVMKGQYVYVCICMYKYMYHYPVQYIVLTYFNCMVQIGATNTICIHHITTGNKQYIVTIRNVHVTYTELKTKHFIGKYSCNNDPS